jgi:hypothetical protein
VEKRREAGAVGGYIYGEGSGQLIGRPSARLPFHDLVTRMLSHFLSLLPSPRDHGANWGSTGEKSGSPLEGSERAFSPQKGAPCQPILPGTQPMTKSAL